MSSGREKQRKPEVGQLLVASEAASYLRVPVATLYAWRYKGEGPPAIKVGRHLRYRTRDVEAWLDELSQDERAR